MIQRSVLYRLLPQGAVSKGEADTISYTGGTIKRTQHLHLHEKIERERKRGREREKEQPD